jgi:hypothetical protein
MLLDYHKQAFQSLGEENYRWCLHDAIFTEMEDELSPIFSELRKKGHFELQRKILSCI